MKKQFEKIIIVAILVISSVTNYAAVVSDNDGSAFVTKSEFEALKDNFANQIINYNDSIDSKIDGAIASYLAGFNLTKKENLQVIYHDWGKVTCMNYALKNDTKLPDVDLNFIGEAYGVPNGEPNSTWNFHCVWQMYYRFLYSRPSSTKQKRLLCDAGVESSTYPTNIFWKGRALDYWEKIAVNQTRVWLPTKTTGQSDGYIDNANQSGVTFYAIKLTKLNQGYYSDLQSQAHQIWQPGVNWRGVYNWCDDNGHGGNVRLKTASTEANLKDVSIAGKNYKTDYDHILHFNSKTLKYLSDLDWLNTFGTDGDNTFTRDSLAKASGASTSGFRASIEVNRAHQPLEGHTDVRPGVSTITSGYSGLYGATDSTKMVSIGLLSTTYTSDKIYQDDKYITVMDNNKEYKTNNHDNLLAGMALLGAEEDSKITWEPKFKTYNNGTETNYEVKVELVVGNFAEGSTTTTGSVVCKNKDQTTDYLTTTNRTCKFDFEMPKSGIVYVKWWPADDSIKNADTWEIDLLLDECNSYERILPS